MSVFDYEAFRKIRLRPQNEIMADWKQGVCKPAVSVVCTAYNHEVYIEDAIKGFLIQETDFPFEIIINDDASTDGTAEIIRSYQERYPSIIRCIYQAENQFSKRNSPLLFLFGEAIGKFVAICEGDDFWISEDKLQKQHDAMVNHPEVSICIHSAYSEIRNYDRQYSCTGVFQEYMTIIPAWRTIIWGGGFCATNSIFIRTEVAKNLPSWVAKAPVLDVFIQGLSSCDSGVLYLPYFMSIYRINTSSSWTNWMGKSYLSDNYLTSYNEAYYNFDTETHGKYSSEISQCVAVLNLSGAISSIRFNKKSDFITRISKSYQSYANVNWIQIFLYRLRSMFVVIRFSYQMYKKLK